MSETVEAAVAERVDGDVGDARDGLPERISFAELVWAHFLRQAEAQGDPPILDGRADARYRRWLRAFEREHGRIVQAYWCRYEPSAVALTEKRRSPDDANGNARVRRWLKWLVPSWVPPAEDAELHFHSVTHWRTAQEQKVASIVHDCDTLAVRVAEVLRGTTERIALQWLVLCASRALGYVDRKDPTANVDPKETDDLVRRQRDELRRIERYYHRAGEKAARLVYFFGMLRCVAWLLVGGVLVALALWFGGAVSGEDTETLYELLACYGMGAAGALVSVMSRMASGGFTMDHEVGRKEIRWLGIVRPAIGAIFAVVLYLALKSNLIRIGELGGDAKTIQFYAAVSFFAGFSERWAKVLIGSAVGSEPERDDGTRGGRSGERRDS